MAIGETSHDRYAKAADTQADRVRRLREEYAELAQQQLGDLEQILRQEELGTEQAAKAAQAHQARADQLERQIELMRILGAAEEHLVELEREALQLRAEAAAMLGNEAEASVHRRQLELSLAKQVADQDKRATEASAKATASAAAQRNAEADALDHEVRALKILGAEQRALLAVEEQSAQLRLRAARAAGDEAEVRKRERALELLHLKQVAAERGRMSVGGGFAAGLTGGIDRAKEAFSGSGIIQAAGAIGQVVTGFSSMISLAERAADAIDGFATRANTAQAAAGSLQVDITGASEAFEGYVDDLRLAGIANKGFALGVITNGRDLEDLAEGVNEIAQQLGGDRGDLLSDAIVGIGRRSTAVLDNLGIIVTAESAERDYAEMLGKTVDQLTAYEKSQSFTKVAIKKVADAARDGAKAQDTYAESYAKTKVSMKNLTDTAFGFDVQGGKIRETLRDLDSEVLKLFGSRSAEDIRKINAELAKSGLNYEQIRDYVIETNNIESLRGGQQNREQRLQTQKALAALTGEALRFQEKQIANAERLAAEAEREAKAKADAEAVADLEHQVALLEAIGAEEDDIVAAKEAALTLQIEQAEAAGDLVKQKELERKLEILLLGAVAKKAKHAGSASTAAERLRATLEAQLGLREDELRVIELQAQLTGQAAQSELPLARASAEQRLAELDAERQSLEITRAKNAAERIRNEARLDQLARERDIIVLEERLADRERENELIAEAVAKTQQQAEAEAELSRQEHQRQTNLIRLDDYRLRARAQSIEAELALAQTQTRSEIEALRLRRDAEGELHDIALAQIDAEHQARLEELAIREAAADAIAEPDLRAAELEQLQHDRTIEMLDYELEVRRSLQDEKVAIAEHDRELLAAQIDRVKDAVGTFEQIRDSVAEVVGFIGERNAAQADADHDRTIRLLTERGRAQKEALDAELEAAKGNASRQAQLRKQAATQERALQKQIEDAERLHNERREREQMRSEGRKLLVLAAVEAIKAVAAFASFNYFEGAAHVAAAAAAAIRGGMLIAGRVPGTDSSTSASAAGSFAAANDSQGYTEPSTVPGSIPGEAARRESATAQVGPGMDRGGTVININNVNANGAVDEDFAFNLARALDEVRYSREA